MQPFEIVLYLLSLFAAVIMVKKKTMNPAYAYVLFGGVTAVLVLHVISEESRWQLYPLYGSVLVLASLLLLYAAKPHLMTKRFRHGSIITVTALLIISGLSTFVFPVERLPEPTGDYPIGTQSFVLEDETRLDIYGDDPTEHRRIKIQLWYPAETIAGYDRAPWLEDGVMVARGLSKDIGLPFFALDHTADIMSHAYLDAPIRPRTDPYPVIILSHGWRGFRNLHTDFAEELASRGYIVVGIDHTHGSVATVFGENDVTYVNPEALPDRESNPDFLENAHRLVSTYKGDIITALDYLETINDPDGPSSLSATMDLAHVGLLGHSTGGGADVAAALEDDRIGAVLGLDAWVEPLRETAINSGLTMPSLFIRSGAWETGFNNDHLTSLIENSDSSGLYQIEDTTHYDFTMVYMFSPLTGIINFTGDVDARHLNRMLGTIITDFFDGVLKNDTDGNIDADAWDEVRRIPTG